MLRAIFDQRSRTSLYKISKKMRDRGLGRSTGLIDTDSDNAIDSTSSISGQHASGSGFQFQVNYAIIM